MIDEELLARRTLLRNYSRALDEIYRLRTALAYEAQVTEAHLQLVGFPKSRRIQAENQVQRMSSAAKGNSASAYALAGPRGLNEARKALGITTLTRQQFEAEIAKSATRHAG